MLIKQKKCRIVFILNEDEIANDDKEALQSYKEKVVDIEIEFNPSIIENFNHIFDKDNEHYEFILSKIQILELRNIRIIKRIKRNIDYLMNLAKIKEQSLVEDLLSHIIVISYIHSSPECQIPIKFLKSIWNV